MKKTIKEAAVEYISIRGGLTEITKPEITALLEVVKRKNSKKRPHT